MKVRDAAVVAILVGLLGCGSSENAPAPAESAVSANRLFDSAVQEATTAYFSHVPESATALGIPETVVPGTVKRMMDRSVAGNAARNEALEAALAGLRSVDAAALSADRQRTYAVLVTLFDGALGPSRVVDYGTTAGAWSMW